MKFLNSNQICPQTEVHLPVFVIVLIERVKIRVNVVPYISASIFIMLKIHPLKVVTALDWGLHK